MRKGLYGFALAVMALFITPVMVDAAGSVTNETKSESYSTISEAISAADPSDVIVLSDTTYTEDVVVDKELTIKGSSKTGTIINGHIDVAADVNIEKLTISDDGATQVSGTGYGIIVKSQATVIVNDVLIKYANYSESNYGNTEYFTGIWLTKTADGSELMVSNSDIYAKYGIWIYGQENTVMITDSKLTGWATLDISNGSSPSGLATNNAVFVSGCTLTGVATLTGNTNDYATIVIGGQDGLELAIENSTIQNKFIVSNVQDLISFGSAYLNSENVIIVIENSKLINNDTTANSAILTYGKDTADPNKNNIVATSNTTMTSSNGKTVVAPEAYVVVRIVVGNEETILTFAKGSTFEGVPEEPEVEGYTFDGWYADKDFKTEFDFDQEINADTVIYAKLDDNTGTTARTSEVNITNPETSDNIVLYILAGLLGAGAMVVSHRKLREA